MSVLFRQADGVEGFLTARKPDHTGDLSVADCPDRPQAIFDFDPAHFPAPSLDHDRNDPVLARLDQLFEVVVNGFPRFVPLAEPFQKGLSLDIAFSGSLMASRASSSSITDSSRTIFFPRKVKSMKCE